MVWIVAPHHTIPRIKTLESRRSKTVAPQPTTINKPDNVNPWLYAPAG